MDMDNVKYLLGRLALSFETFDEVVIEQENASFKLGCAVCTIEDIRKIYKDLVGELR